LQVIRRIVYQPSSDVYRCVVRGHYHLRVSAYPVTAHEHRSQGGRVADNYVTDAISANCTNCSNHESIQTGVWRRSSPESGFLPGVRVGLGVCLKE